MEKMRLQKFLSKGGVCSRRKGEEHILAGRIKVNGQVMTELGTSVTPGTDKVEFDGKLVELKSKLIYIALNKPVGYVSSLKQPGEKLITDLVDIPDRVFPVGRLDKDSKGLILLTNDGELHNRLAHPSFNHEKEYVVKTWKPIPDKALEKMSKGLTLRGTMTRPAKVKRLSPSSFKITLKEGRNRQIRKMVRITGSSVKELERKRIAGISLGSLVEGTWRYLTNSEIKALDPSHSKSKEIA